MQTVADFNGDGKDDLSILDLNSGILWIATSNGSTFSANFATVLPATPLSLVNEFAGDFTGDGLPDLAHFFTNSTTTQWWVTSKNSLGQYTTSKWR